MLPGENRVAITHVTDGYDQNSFFVPMETLEVAMAAINPNHGRIIGLHTDIVQEAADRACDELADERLSSGYSSVPSSISDSDRQLIELGALAMAAHLREYEGL